MDDEDIADAADAQRVQTADGFSGLGSTEDDTRRQGAFIDLFRIEGETIGAKLLKKMGWKEGQGVGPKVRRPARLEGVERPRNDSDITHLFAPENTKMISFIRKNDHKGLGFDGETKLASITGPALGSAKSDVEDDDHSLALIPKPKKKPVRGGIGIGILNDTGSDDEDPYEIGPRISYNRVIGGDKKKKKPIKNTLLASKPVFISKKTALAKAAIGLRKCHDGRLPLDGFILSTVTSLSTNITYPPPTIPPEWTSRKIPASSSLNPNFTSTADLAKASKLDPKSRASILGEASLPGKSVFDFLTPAARARLASASGKSDLPPALSEIPAGYALTPAQRQAQLLSSIPRIELDTAEAALSRGNGGFMPYGEDLPKRERYRKYLEHQIGSSPDVPPRLPGTRDEDWLKELQEFRDCANIFRPMSGLIANKFTSSSAPKSIITGAGESIGLVPKKAEDPAEQAAKMGMFGPMTRSSESWMPTRLLCKRMNVKAPAHAKGDNEKKDVDELFSMAQLQNITKWGSGGGGGMQGAELAADVDMGGMEAPSVDVQVEKQAEELIDSERNEALEGEKAGEAVFKAIFGDDSDEDE